MWELQGERRFCELKGSARGFVFFGIVSNGARLGN